MDAHFFNSSVELSPLSAEHQRQTSLRSTLRQGHDLSPVGSPLLLQTRPRRGTNNGSVLCIASSPQEEFFSHLMHSVVAKASALVASIGKRSQQVADLL